MKTKQDFKHAVEILREAINEIDPYSLLASGSPDDEFENEINSIASQLSSCESGKDIAHTIARVFTSSFGEEFESSQFLSEGEDVYTKLQSNDLV